MDKANCLHNMTIRETNALGLGLYAKEDETAYQNLRNGHPILPLIPKGPTINKRVKLLQRGLFPNDDAMAELLSMQAPERLLV